MTFLNPLVLLGLAAAAIPLIIHLFHFQRPRRVDFSSLSFIRAVERSTMRRVRVKQWLLLALRTLAIAALVLAFARPTLMGAIGALVGGDARSSVGLVIDNSLSMTMRDEGGAYLDQAIEAARTVGSLMRPGDRVILQATSGPGRPAAADFGTAEALGRHLDALAPAGPARPLAEVVRTLAERLADEPQVNRELYVLTDGQAATFGTEAAASRASDAGVRAVLLKVGSGTRANLSVEDVEVESLIIEPDQPVRVRARVMNYGDEPFAGYSASIYLDGRRVARASADVPARSPATLTFTLTPGARGWLAGEVRGEDDAYEFDNTRHFVLHVPDRRRVLLVRGSGEDVSYLRTALSPSLAPGKQPFDLTEIPETGLSSQTLTAFDAVVLAGPSDLSTGEVAGLARYVESGGGLMAFPGSSGPTADYDALFAATGGGSLGVLQGDDGRQVVTRVETVEREHPIFDGVFERSNETEDSLEQPDIFRLAAYRPVRGSERTVIAAGNGLPFVQEMRHGTGSVLFVAVAPIPSWSDLPVSGLFVPLVYRSLFYLSAGGARETDAVQMGEPARIQVAGQREDLRVVGPGGEDFTPEQQTRLGTTTLQLGEQISAPGLYDVMSGDRLIRRIAVNRSSVESDLAALEVGVLEDRLETIFGTRPRVLQDPGAAAVSRALTESRTGVELWNVFLVVALLLLIAEMLVAGAWRPESA